MNFELFPFEKVPKYSRVVIYGFGEVGRNYWMQLKRTNYAEVIAVADKSKEKYGDIFQPLISLSDFYDLPLSNYDFVVISISNPEVSQSVIDDFLKHKIPAEKIIYDLNSRAIWDGDMICLVESELMGEDLFKSPERILVYLNTMSWMGCNRSWNDYREIIKFINKNRHSKQKLIDLFKGKILDKLSDMVRLKCLRLLYDQRVFDADCLNMFMDTLRTMPWDDDTPYFSVLNSDLPMAFHCREAVYDDFYLERRALMQRLVSHYKLRLPDKQTPQERKKLAFVCYSFEFANVVYTLARQHIDGFLSQGYEVLLVILGAFGEPDWERVAFPPLWLTHKPEEFEWRIADWFPRGVDSIYIEECDIAQRMQRAIDTICDYNPRFILDMSDECFPEGWLLLQRYPIIEMPLRGFATSAAFDCYITNNPAKVLETGTVPREKIKYLNLGNLPQKKNQPVYTREEFGLSDNDFLMITVGSRLQWEASPEFIRYVCKLMDQEKSIRWILVEDITYMNSDFPLFKKYLESGRIIRWGYEYHLESLYKIVDVFLNPNRQGGGVAIRQAMAQGVPIAMTDFPSDNLGRMQGHVVHGGYSNLMKYIQHLYHDREFWKSESQIMRDLMSDYLPHKDAEQVLQACEETWRRVISLKQG